MIQTEKMRAAVLVAPKKFELRSVPVPIPDENEILVRLEGCGICGSNLSPFEGRPWFEYPREPGDPGHEGWGEIAAVGSKVRNLLPGQRVAFLSYHAFSEYDLAQADSAVLLPPQLEKQPFPGEALGCAMNVFRRADVAPGQTIAVVGIGFLGGVITALAAHAGASVIAISRRPFALEIARTLGAQHLVPMDDHWKIIEAVKALTAGAGADRVIEAVGSQWPLDLAAELTRERGKLIVAGYHQDGPRQVNMQLWNWRGLDVINAHERDSKVYVRGMREAIELVGRQDLNLSPLFTHSFPLDQINEGFQMLTARPAGFLKGVITL